MAGVGASRPSRRVLAMVSFLNPEPAIRGRTRTTPRQRRCVRRPISDRVRHALPATTTPQASRVAAHRGPYAAFGAVSIPAWSERQPEWHEQQPARALSRGASTRAPAWPWRDQAAGRAGGHTHGSHPTVGAAGSTGY